MIRADPKTLKYTLANLMNAVPDDTELELFMDRAVVKGEGVHYIPANSKLAEVSSRLAALQMSGRCRQCAPLSSRPRRLVFTVVVSPMIMKSSFACLEISRKAMPSKHSSRTGHADTGRGRASI